MKFNFNEEQKLRNVIEHNDVSDLSISSAIWYAAVYYTHINQVGNKKDLFNTIVNFMNSNYNDFKYEGYVDLINNKINKAKNHIIININVISITESEINKIKSLENQCLEKLAFVLLALAKYENARSSSTKDTLYAKIPEIFRLARLAIPKAERNKYLHTMYKEGIISMNFSIGYDAITVGFISHNNDDPVVLNLDEYDYMELAYAYLNYKNGGYKRCKVCNKWFKTKTHEWYCRVHRKAYEPTGIREVECIDCGMVFQVPSTNTRTCRCEECQKHATLNKYAKYNAKRNS